MLVEARKKRCSVQLHLAPPRRPRCMKMAERGRSGVGGAIRGSVAEGAVAPAVQLGELGPRAALSPRGAVVWCHRMIELCKKWYYCSSRVVINHRFPYEFIGFLSIMLQNLINS